MKRQISTLFLIAFFCFWGCKETCSVDTFYMENMKIPLNKLDTANVFYGHKLILQSISTARIPADTASMTDSVITAQSIKIFLRDTSRKIHRVLDLPIRDIAGVNFGNNTAGANFTYINIVCDSVRLVDSSAFITVWRYGYTQNCGSL